jgi:TFIIF-interacting CTD phosphatase-like protein
MSNEAWAKAHHAMSERIRELERQLSEAVARAEFAEDQHDVAIKDRDYAESSLTALSNAINTTYAWDSGGGYVSMSSKRWEQIVALAALPAD